MKSWIAYIDYLKKKTGGNDAYISAQISDKGSQSCVSVWRRQYRKSGIDNIPTTAKSVFMTNMFAKNMGCMTYEEYMEKRAIAHYKKMQEQAPASEQIRSELVKNGLIKECAGASDVGMKQMHDLQAEVNNQMAERMDAIVEASAQVIPKKSKVAVSVPDSCGECRFKVLEDPSDGILPKGSAVFYKCLLFEKSLFSNAKGEIMRLEECGEVK